MNVAPLRHAGKKDPHIYVVSAIYKQTRMKLVESATLDHQNC